MSTDNRKQRKNVYTLLGIIITAIAIFVSIIVWRYPNPAPTSDFSISVNPMSSSVSQGSVINTTITVRSINNYEHDISLSASGEPSDVVIAFSPLSGKAKTAFISTMIINVGMNALEGDYTITIKGLGADGKEHFCKHILKIILRPVSTEPSIAPLNQIHTIPPVESYMVYSDVGIAAGDVQVWSGEDNGLASPLLVDGDYITTNPPEGDKCFAVTSGEGYNNYIGWGVFLGIFRNHKLVRPQRINLSDYKNLQFYVKTSINLKVEIQQDNSDGAKSFSCLISNFGWNSSLPNDWQKVTIPKSAFRNVDLTRIFCPFMITGNGGRITFYIDEVIWVP
jgi:hypothetical protein